MQFNQSINTCMWKCRVCCVRNIIATPRSRRASARVHATDSLTTLQPLYNYKYIYATNICIHPRASLNFSLDIYKHGACVSCTRVLSTKRLLMQRIFSLFSLIMYTYLSLYSTKLFLLYRWWHFKWATVKSIVVHILSVRWWWEYQTQSAFLVFFIIVHTKNVVYGLGKSSMCIYLL